MSSDKTRRTIEIEETVEIDKDKVDFAKDGKYKFYPDNPTSAQNKRIFSTKLPSQFFDPCQEASKMSIGCLERNNYDKDQCTEYFKAYKDCKAEWTRQRKVDRKAGKSW